MFVVFLKSIITFLVVFFVIRLMGKRQIGEMQPFELVITLIIAEVACIPMNDPYIPLYYGFIPILTLATLHILLSFFSRKSVKLRKLLSGSSMIVIDKNGINYENMKKMNMNIDDLIEAVRTAGYVDFTEIAYAIFEPNGQLCVVEKEEQADDPSDGSEQSKNSSRPPDSSQSPDDKPPALLPIELVVDGQYIEHNLRTAGVMKSDIDRVLSDNGLKLGEILYADVRQNGKIYFSPKKSTAFCGELEVKGNW